METWIYDLSMSNHHGYAPAPHPLLQALHHGGQVGQPVLLVLLHLHLELLLGHAAEVAVLLHGLQQHIALVLPLLSQGPKYLRLLGLEEEEAAGSRENESERKSR